MVTTFEARRTERYTQSLQERQSRLSYFLNQGNFLSTVLVKVQNDIFEAEQRRNVKALTIVLGTILGSESNHADHLVMQGYSQDAVDSRNSLEAQLGVFQGGINYFAILAPRDALQAELASFTFCTDRIPGDISRSLVIVPREHVQQNSFTVSETNFADTRLNFKIEILGGMRPVSLPLHDVELAVIRDLPIYRDSDK